jgi:hypothetical protein
MAITIEAIYENGFALGPRMPNRSVLASGRLVSFIQIIPRSKPWPQNANPDNDSAVLAGRG